MPSGHGPSLWANPAAPRCRTCRRPDGERTSVLPGGYWWDFDENTWVGPDGKEKGDLYLGSLPERFAVAHLREGYCETCYPPPCERVRVAAARVAQGRLGL